MPIIHKVQAGDTIASIAEQYQIPMNRLLTDNRLSPESKLNIGQIIVITMPKLTYIVKEGDVLKNIAQENGATVMELLRNNPSLSNREYLTIGEELVIKYDSQGRKLKVNGFTFSFIREDILKMTLPFLTYITVMGHQVDANGNISDTDSTFITQTAVNYGVIPLMFISTLDESGHGSTEITHTIMNSKDLQNKLINNMLSVIKNNGYYGTVFGFQNILKEDIDQYIEFIAEATQQLHKEGFLSDVILIPSTFGFTEYQRPEQPHLTRIGQIVDGVILLSYQWARGYVPNNYQTSFSYLKNYLTSVITQISPEKIYMGISRIAYDWELPYYDGVSHVSALTNPSALALASQYNSEIFFDENTQFPYFNYMLAGTEHIVWFKDARHTNAILNLVNDYGLGGVAIWNIMDFFRIWLIINTQYNIQKLLPVE